jgi:hypothetical protein
MNERQFKEAIRELLHRSSDTLSPDAKVTLAKLELVDFQKEQVFPTPNKGEPWTDDQLRVVLSYAPTAQNTMMLARAFGRGYGSIEQIFRWAGQSERRIQEERGEHAFVQQVLRIRKELRWRSVGGDA